MIETLDPSVLDQLTPDTRAHVVTNGHTTELSLGCLNWIARAVAAQDGGDVAGAIAHFRQAVAVEAEPRAATCVVMLTDLYSDDPDLVLGVRREFDARFCRVLTETAPPRTNDRDPDRKLRVGYLSADFRAHSAAYLLIPWIGAHDRAQFEATFYMTGRTTDPVTDEFRVRADTWREVPDLDEATLADAIRADGIDVLVDLAGYTQGNRVLTLARRPAPVQITGWGSTLGTGLACQDYLVSDAVSIPRTHEHLYRERIIRLPCLVAFRPPSTAPAVAAPPIETNGYPTFGYLGRPTKISDETFQAWAQILRRTDGRLFVKNGEYGNERMQLHVVKRLMALGVRGDRITLVGHTGWGAHLAAYNGVDVTLDTWPENGGTTIMDTLLMGVPVVAKLGRFAPGRQASSIVQCVGLADPIATSEEYVERAIAWSEDVDFLREMRRTLRDRLLASPVCDGRAYAAAWGDELRRAWRAWCR